MARGSAALREVRPGRHVDRYRGHLRRRRRGSGRTRRRRRHRPAATGLAPCCRHQLGVDRAAASRVGTDQQGRQDRADHRRHHRRRERRPETRQAAGRSAGVRQGRGHRARQWRRGELRAGQQPNRKRSAADGIHRHPVELRRAGLGVRRPLGGGAARCGGRVRDPEFDGGVARYLLRHRRVHLCTEPRCRIEFGVGHRLHTADRQPVPRRTRRRRGRGTRR